MDLDKALDSLQRSSLWKILQHHGIQQKFVNIIQALCVILECRVIHNNQVTEPYRVATCVKQGRILSPVLLSVAVDWFMPTVNQGSRLGIRWTLLTVLDDLDYADDIGLLSSKHHDAKQKAERLSKPANTIGLNVNTMKTNVLRRNIGVNDPVMIDGKHLEDVD